MNNIVFKDLSITHIVDKKLKNSYIKIDRESNIVIKTPKVPNWYIDNFLDKKEKWIRKHLAKNQQKPPIYLSLEGIESKQSMFYLAQRVEYFSKLMNLSYSSLKFRKMKRRWGSCNSKGVITLNKKLIKTPKICIDYVIIHELAHIEHLNHSRDFHLLVEKYCDFSKDAKDILSRVVFCETV